jgi:prepilin-type N-terminal cleavage/methylation domain-containing protein
MCVNSINGLNSGTHSVSVEWHDSTWKTSIDHRNRRRIHQDHPTKPLPGDLVLSHPVRFQNPAMSMKNIGNRKPVGGASPAFTLVELLTVIAIIGILAGMLAVVLPAATKKAKVMKAKTEIAGIVTAIQAYDQDYSKFPITRDERDFAIQNLQGAQTDFTTGMRFGPGNGKPYNSTPLPGYSYDDNRQAVAILMDLEKFPNGVVSSNVGHVYNPKQVKYLNAKMSGYDPLPNDPNPPGGVDNTGVYRDPWGTPYVITMDLSYDDQCSDLLYCLQSVSQVAAGKSAGYNGLFNPAPNPDNDNFLFHGKVMVWSAGPDRTYDAGPAVLGKNKDNVLSWQ